MTIDGALVPSPIPGLPRCERGNVRRGSELAECAISLVAEYAPTLIADPANVKAREAIGLATDLGGYAIMIGGTSGAHLTSFSLVDIVAHGTACGIMNPYYAVLYSKAIQKQLKVVGAIFAKYGFGYSVEKLEGRELAVAVAEMILQRLHQGPDEAQRYRRPHRGHITVPWRGQIAAGDEVEEHARSDDGERCGHLYGALLRAAQAETSP